MHAGHILTPTWPQHYNRLIYIYNNTLVPGTLTQTYLGNIYHSKHNRTRQGNTKTICSRVHILIIIKDHCDKDDCSQDDTSNVEGNSNLLRVIENLNLKEYDKLL